MTELECLAKLLYAECRGEPVDGQLAVGTVVMNRVACQSGVFKKQNTVQDVVLAQGQFARLPVEIKEPQAYERCKQTAQKVLDGYRCFPSFVLYFQKKREARFWATWHCQIGCHNFYGDPP